MLSVMEDIAVQWNVLLQREGGGGGGDQASTILCDVIDMTSDYVINIAERG